MRLIIFCTYMGCKRNNSTLSKEAATVSNKAPPPKKLSFSLELAIQAKESLGPFGPEVSLRVSDRVSPKMCGVLRSVPRGVLRALPAPGSRVSKKCVPQSVKRDSCAWPASSQSFSRFCSLDLGGSCGFPNGRRGHYERGLFTGGISRISEISTFPRISRQWFVFHRSGVL